MSTVMSYKCVYKFCTETPFCINISKQRDCENKRSIYIIVMYICVVLYFNIYAGLCVQVRAFTQNWHYTYFLGLDFVSYV
jgi:hypothetical protein